MLFRQTKLLFKNYYSIKHHPPLPLLSRVAPASDQRGGGVNPNAASRVSSSPAARSMALTWDGVGRDGAVSDMGGGVTGVWCLQGGLCGVVGRRGGGSGSTKSGRRWLRLAGTPLVGLSRHSKEVVHLGLGVRG